MVDRHTLTVREAAKALGVAEGTVRRAIKRGDLPARKFGRRTLIVRDVFQRWLDKPLNGPQTEQPDGAPRAR